MIDMERTFLIIKKDIKRNKKYISEVVKSDMYPSDKAKEDYVTNVIEIEEGKCHTYIE